LAIRRRSPLIGAIDPRARSAFKLVRLSQSVGAARHLMVITP
jgi:hypothetical protein